MAYSNLQFNKIIHANILRIVGRVSASFIFVFRIILNVFILNIIFTSLIKLAFHKHSITAGGSNMPKNQRKSAEISK